MAVSSPNVVARPPKELDLMGAGMQLGALLGQQKALAEQKKQNDANNAKTILDFMGKSAGSPDAMKLLLKDEKSQSAVSGLFQNALGMNKTGADNLVQALGNQMFESLPQAMTYAKMFDTYGAQGQAPPEDMLDAIKTDIGGGQGELQTTAPVPEDQTTTTVYGKTYQYDPAKLSTGTAPVQTTGTNAGTVSTTSTAPAPTATPGPKPTPSPTPDMTPTMPPEATPAPDYATGAAPKTTQTVKGATTDAVASVNRGLGTKPTTTAGIVSNPVGTQTIEEKQVIQSGTWTVKNPKGEVGKVTNGRFQPSDDFMWTNETEMWGSLAGQVWGDKASDVEAFKQMAYANAKKEGYKGTYDQFVKPPLGRKTANETMMPQGFDWMRKNGLQITKPSEVSAGDPMVTTAGTTKLKPETVSSLHSELLRKTEKVNNDFGELYKDPNQFAAMISNFDGYGTIQKGRIKTKEDAKWYAAWRKYKENEDFSSKFLGVYGNYMSKDPESFRKVVEHNQRVYDSFGGDQIMQILVPNQQALEEAKFKSQQELAWAQYGLSEAGLELEKEKLIEQKLATDEEFRYKWSMAQMAAQKVQKDSNSDSAQTISNLQKNAWDILKVYKDKGENIYDYSDPTIKRAWDMYFQADMMLDPSKMYYTIEKNGKQELAIHTPEEVATWMAKNGKLNQFLIFEWQDKSPGAVPVYNNMTAPMTETEKKQSQSYADQQKKLSDEANQTLSALGL